MDNNEDLKNAIQPLRNENRKALINKVLLIAWLAVCTTIFVYFIVIHIGSICISLQHISDWKSELAEDPKFAAAVIAGVESNIRAVILYLIFQILLYVSFLVLAIPKLIKAFRPSVIKNGIDEPTL